LPDIHRYEGAVLFVVVILGTAGIVIGWQEYDYYLADQATASYLCSQGEDGCSPFYLTNGNFFIKGAHNQTSVTLPPNCDLVSCRVSLNLTIRHPERLTMVYRAPVSTYAELDWLAPTGQWVEAMHSPGGLSGFIKAGVPCNFGTYRYWFSSGPNNTRYTLAVDIQVARINLTVSCG
jgi:hypothetical protein